MYPIPEHRKQIYEYYRLTFDETGCPMKQMDGKQVFHPILPPYLIVDYLAVYKKTQDIKYLEYAEQIADMAYSRGSDLDGAWVFYYLPESGLSSVKRRFYSALTQAWWVRALCALERLKPGVYAEKIRAVYQSLLIPIQNGGVLFDSRWGWIVEEYPHEPIFITLNGWLTVLRWIIASRDVLGCVGIQIDEFLSRNFDAVERLLPLYDMPQLNNSRYQLTGYSRIKLVTDKSAEVSCGEFSVHIPGEGDFEGIFNSSDRWYNHLMRQENRQLVFNVVLSLAAFPEQNVFSAKIDANQAAQLRIYVAKGGYRPDATGMPTERWDEIGPRIQLIEGSNDINIQIPYDDLNLFAYPTNFKKLIGGTNYNGYHFVHVVDLAEIYSYSRRPIFLKYCELWLSYIQNWDSMPVLTGFSKESHIYGDFKSFSATVRKILGNDQDKV